MSNGNEGVLHISQISEVGASPSVSLMSYPGHLLGKFHPSAEMQSVYSTAPANWASLGQIRMFNYFLYLKAFNCVQTNV